jgi:hypothetical protein
VLDPSVEGGIVIVCLLAYRRKGVADTVDFRQKAGKSTLVY